MSDREGDPPRPTETADGTLAVVWRIVRGLLLATGIIVLVSGLLIAFVPGAERLFPIEAAVAALGSDYVVVAAVGLLAVSLSALVIAARRVRGVTEATPPIVEDVQSATYPGERFDRSARGISGRLSGASERRERLEEAAIRVTMRTEGCTRTAAAETVAEGAWTDDPVAAGYLSEGRRIGQLLRPPGRENRAVRRTVDAIAASTRDGNGSRRRTRRSDGRGE